MRLLLRVLPLALLAMPAMAATPAPVANPQSQVRAQPRPLTAEERIELLERRVQVLNDVLFRLDRLQQEVQQLRGDVELQSNSMEGLKKRQRDLYLDVDRRLGQMSASPPATPMAGQQPGMATGGTPPAAPATGVAQPGAAPQQPAAPATASQQPIVPFSSPSAVTPMAADPALEQGVYQQAFDLLMQRRYDEAKQGFQQFLAQYPSGRLTANAQYWLAEASYVTRDFPTALVEFAKVIEGFPTSAKVSDALLKTGYIYYEQKEWVRARETLQGLVDNYPASTVARLAQKRLERMRAEGH
ncbi:tol-pal system protein YbgF [Pseudomonadota bacterium]